MTSGVQQQRILMGNIYKISRYSSIVPALIMAVLFLSGLVVTELMPADKGLVAAVFAPGTSTEKMVRAAFDARASILDRHGSLLFVYSDQGGLPQRLRAAGARFVISPIGAAGCRPLLLPGDETFGRLIKVTGSDVRRDADAAL